MRQLPLGIHHIPKCPLDSGLRRNDVVSAIAPGDISASLNRLGRQYSIMARPKMSPAFSASQASLMSSSL